MSAKCKHAWKFRVSQDGLLYVRFCQKCTICEYLDSDRAWSSMRYAAGLPKARAAEVVAAVIPGTGLHLGLGTHDYPGVKDGQLHFTSDCANGCGCWMGGSRSGGPEGVDAFGKCPKENKAKALSKD